MHECKEWSGGPYRVIVGRGFSAILNHVTLPPDEARNVIHVGGPDPWGLYNPHLQMGQWPCLLSLPGFRSPCRETPDEFLPAGLFSKAVSGKASDIRCKGYVPSNVIAVREKGSDFEVVLNQDNEPIHASHVDFCTGPGPGRAPREGIPEALGRSVLLAGAFLSEETPTSDGGSLCVIGDGPTSAWCVEKALDLGYQVLWAARGKVNKAFVPSRRNHRLAARVPDEEEERAVADLDPNEDRKLGFAEGFAVTIDGEKSKEGCVRLLFEQHQPGVHGRWCQWTSGYLFERVVFAIGNDDSAVRELTRANNIDIIRPILAHDGTFAGLQDSTRRIRVLGAAALGSADVDFKSVLSGQVQPDYSEMLRSPIEKLCAYAKSLHAQAQDGMGITLSAIMIALANGFFARPADLKRIDSRFRHAWDALKPLDESGRRNTNLNTMSHAELSERIGEDECVRICAERKKVPLTKSPIGRLGFDYQED